LVRPEGTLVETPTRCSNTKNNRDDRVRISMAILTAVAGVWLGTARATRRGEEDRTRDGCEEERMILGGDGDAVIPWDVDMASGEDSVSDAGV